MCPKYQPDLRYPTYFRIRRFTSQIATCKRWFVKFWKEQSFLYWDRYAVRPMVLWAGACISGPPTHGCKRHALVDGKQAVPPCTTPCFWLAMCNKTCRWPLNSRNIMQKALICVNKCVCMGSFRRRKWISTIACHDERDLKLWKICGTPVNYIQAALG